MASNGDTAAEEPVEPKLSFTDYLRKLWEYRKYLVIEPPFFFYYMASLFNSVAMQNFPLDKACRVNLGYNKIVCDTTLDKSELGIDCDGFTFENTTLGATADLFNLTIGAMGFNYTVCKAEVEAQTLASDVSGKRAPIASIFPLIVLLFAGGWSDRYNKRKPCMILPIFGEMMSFLCLFISAIFFDSLPMEFGAYLEAIVPALFGGLTFCLMAVYSYMTIATPEEDRVFRFGIFAIFVNAVPFIGLPVSGYLFLQLGYAGSFAMAFIFQVIAITLIIFVIDEVNAKSLKPNTQEATPQLQPAKEGAENLAYEITNIDEASQNNKNVSFEMTPPTQIPPKHEPPKEDIAPVHRSCCASFLNHLREFFDPTLVMDCIRFPLIKRKNNGRMLLILLISAYFLTVGPGSGENDYWYRYVLRKLNWNGNDYSFYYTFSSGMALIGVFIGTAILSKWLKFSDSIVGMLSAFTIVCSRVAFAFSNTSAIFYLGGVLEMFVNLRVIAIKTIGSLIVEGEELSKMYSIFGISEPIGQFIFPYIYSEIYKGTVESFPGAVFLFSEIFYIPNVFVFVLCYFILRRNKQKAAAEKKNIAAIEAGQNEQNRANGSSTATSPDSEITSL